MSDVIDRTVRRSFSALCEEVGTPLSQAAKAMLDKDDWLGLATLKVAPGDYLSPSAYLADAQIAGFFKKFPDLPTGVDLHQVAVDTFYEAEAQCYSSNERLVKLLDDVNHYGSRIGDVVVEARKIIKRVLGRAPLPAEMAGKFGPGSTFLDKGPLITVPDKMSENATMTQPAHDVFHHDFSNTAWMRYAMAGGREIRRWNPEVNPHGVKPNRMQAELHKTRDYAIRDYTIVRGNRFTSVPKDSTKNRGICIEPSVNLFYQLAGGGFIGNRMRAAWGWNKATVQDRHRELAREASLLGHLATIDLSNASDTVCWVLVALLLPTDWYELLNSLRSRFTLMEGKWTKLEKFSSMGNGFTFELETLIFRGLAEAISLLRGVDGVISTFGDDIIVPTSISSDVIAALVFFGFSPNRSKTFTNGRFRESCGGDFFDGVPVRPFHQKENPREPHHYIALANKLRRFGRTYRTATFADPDSPIPFRISWLRILDALPSNVRALRGPEHLGDLVIHDEEMHWRFTTRSSRRYFRVWRPVSHGFVDWHHFRPGVLLATALYVSERSLGDQTLRCLYDYRFDWTSDDDKSSLEFVSRHLASQGFKPLLKRGASYVSGYRFGQIAWS